MKYNEAQEVVREAIKSLTLYDRNCKISMGMAIQNTKKFLTDKFDLKGDKWRVEQFNRNRATEDQVHTVEELEAAVEKLFPK
jgi:hypothetical protein